MREEVKVAYYQHNAEIKIFIRDIYYAHGGMKDTETFMCILLVKYKIFVN